MRHISRSSENRFNFEPNSRENADSRFHLAFHDTIDRFSQASFENTENRFHSSSIASGLSRFFSSMNENPPTNQFSFTNIATTDWSQVYPQYNDIFEAIDSIPAVYYHSCYTCPSCLNIVKPFFNICTCGQNYVLVDRNLLKAIMVTRRIHWNSPLTVSEAGAVNLWTLHTHIGPNHTRARYLNDHDVIAKMTSFTDLLTAAVDKLTTQHSDWKFLYRGCSTLGGSFDVNGKTYFYLRNYTSTSPDFNVARSFLNGINPTMIIFITRRGAKISQYSAYPFEKEVILKPQVWEVVPPSDPEYAEATHSMGIFRPSTVVLRSCLNEDYGKANWTTTKPATKLDYHEKKNGFGTATSIYNSNSLRNFMDFMDKEGERLVGKLMSKDSFTKTSEALVHSNSMRSKLLNPTTETLASTSDFIMTETTRQNYLRILEAVDSGVPLLLEGGTGVGKSATIQAAAKQKKVTLVRFNMSTDVTIDDIVGRNMPQDGIMQFTPVTAHERGDLFFFDEFNLAHDCVLQRMILHVRTLLQCRFGLDASAMESLCLLKSTAQAALMAANAVTACVFPCVFFLAVPLGIVRAVLISEGGIRKGIGNIIPNLFCGLEKSGVRNIRTRFGGESKLRALEDSQEDKKITAKVSSHEPDTVNYMNSVKKFLKDAFRPPPWLVVLRPHQEQKQVFSEDPLCESGDFERITKFMRPAPVDDVFLHNFTANCLAKCPCICKCESRLPLFVRMVSDDVLCLESLARQSELNLCTTANNVFGLGRQNNVFGLGRQNSVFGLGRQRLGVLIRYRTVIPILNLTLYRFFNLNLRARCFVLRVRDIPVDGMSEMVQCLIRISHHFLQRQDCDIARSTIDIVHCEGTLEITVNMIASNEAVLGDDEKRMK